MEIIKRGNPPRYDITCPTCQSVIRCVLGELECVALGYGDWIYRYTCPVCGTENTISDKKLTDGKVVGD